MYTLTFLNILQTAESTKKKKSSEKSIALKALMRKVTIYILYIFSNTNNRSNLHSSRLRHFGEIQGYILCKILCFVVVRGNAAEVSNENTSPGGRGKGENYNKNGVKCLKIASMYIFEC